MSSMQKEIDAVVARYQPEIDGLAAEGQRMKEDFERPGDAAMVIGVDVDVSWEQTDLSFDLPEVTMKRHEISFDLPQITMKTNQIVFDTPSVRMETRVVGYVPEFRGFPPKISMKELKMDVPVTFMERQRISFDIPEVKMERTDISFDVPEFRMKRFEFSLSLPQFKIISVNASIDAMKERGEALKRKGELLASAMKAEIQNVLGGGTAEGTQTILDQRGALAVPFDNAVQKIELAINDLVAKKIDPVKVPAEGGNINLRQALADVVTQRSVALAEFDANVSVSITQ